ncbi:MAG: cysteine hydrolase, partial [Oxalobacteraceae bacterium]
MRRWLAALANSKRASVRRHAEGDSLAELHLTQDIREQLRPSHTALLIVDMQNDFCTPGFGAEAAGRDISVANDVTPTIARLLAAARKSGVAVAHVGFWTLPHNSSDSDAWLVQRRKATYSGDKLCLAGTPGAEFIAPLAPIEDEWVIHKHRYSAFTATSLDLLLRARNIGSVVVTGVSTNACVESTFRAAFELGYHVAVPVDGCGSWDRGLHDASLANVRHRFGSTPTADDIVAIW